MIAVMLRELVPRLCWLGVVAVGLYFLEPAFHQHGVVDPGMEAELQPVGISATLAYLSALGMILLLSGFISADVREGYAAIHFSHPTSPLAFYGLRWLMALGVTLLAAAAFLVVGQLVAWGSFRGGGSGLLLALLAALVYGGLVAFFSAVLRSGEAWLVLLLFLPTPVPAILDWLQAALPGGAYALVRFLLPPQQALQEVYRGLVLNSLDWLPVLYAAGYGCVWLIMAGVMLQMRKRF